MPASNTSTADDTQSGSAVADQQPPSAVRLLTPTKIAAWLDCSHHLTLSQAVEAGSLTVATGHLSAFARLLMEKGMDHERAQLRHLQSEGRSVAMVPARNLAEESFEQWCERVRPLLAEGHEIVYQFPMIHEGIRGIADFLIKVDTPSDLGAFSYEPADAKLARLAAKPSHVLQLCFYADGLAAIQGTRPAHAHIFLGSGQAEEIALAQVEAYWHRVRRRIFEQLNAETPIDTVAEPCQHCEFCEFADHCDAQWRHADAIHFVSSITRRERERCAANEITTLVGLAESKDAIVEIRPERNEYLRNQARLQAAAIPGEVPPWEMRVIHEPTGESDVGDMDGPDDFRLRLPAPHPGDVMLDFEGHPFWSAEAGLFFLFGWLRLDPDSSRPATGEWIYDSLWSHSREEEAAHTAELITWLAHRREQFPGMHVYHYNHTERSSLERLAAEHGAGESALAALISDGVFVDLLDLVRRRVQIGAESYGLKVTEILAGYRRSEEIGNGAGAVVQYEQWMHDTQTSHLIEIAAYNEEDVRATLAVRDWIATEVLVDEPWRELPEVEDTEREENEFDLVIAELMATGVAEHRLLGHLLGYWWREGRTHRTQRTAIFDAQLDEQLDNREVIAGLEFRGSLPPKKGQRLDAVLFSFPPQVTELTTKDRGQKLLFRFPSGLIGFSSIRDLDLEEGTVAISWKEEYREAGGFPSAVITEDWVHPKPKPEELLAFARRQLSGEHHPADAARLAVLRREIPQIGSSGVDGPSDTARIFSSDLDELTSLIPDLTDGCLAVQGPPGTGKTYTGARMIAALVAAGQRVGVTAFSHKAIDNLLWEISRTDPSIRFLRQGSNREGIPNLTLDPKREKWDKRSHDVLAGTTWLFSREDMTADPAVDVLVIDEAGQLGLADALAAMGSARKVILLGDPMQLPQVSKAVHPEGSGASVLEHVIGDDPTIDAQRGVFLETTRRMHPDISGFISRQIYEDRLVAHETCARQSVGGETGLRWVRSVHSGCDTSSMEEAQIVSQLVRSTVGRVFTDRHGETRVLTAADVMVVAPYNDQVDLITEVLSKDPETAGAQVGTVDKFQGREAPVVIFSMTASSGDEVVKGLDFLYSRERLNVAISRAKALAYLICTEELFNTRARTVEQMRLIGMLCAFIEHADHVDGRSR